MVDPYTGAIGTGVERVPTMTGLLNHLIMLLSTDWFVPYWEVIGIKLDEPEKGLVHQGCRQIVDQIISGATEYWLISFSPDHYRETRARVEELAQKYAGGEALTRAAEEWSAISEEDLKAGWLFESITEDLLSDDASLTGHMLDFELRAIVLEARKDQYFTSIDFGGLSINSRTAWDRYIRQLTPDLPTYLSDMLSTFLKARIFKAFWTAILGKLTQEQREELTGWYKAAARSRAKRDIAPSYFPGESLLT